MKARDDPYADMQDLSKQVPFVSIDQLTTLMKNDKSVLFVDARSPQHYEAGHIPGAVSMPLAEIPDLAANIDKNRKIVTYCRGYDRSLSTRAANEFIRLGFTDVSDYMGGIEEWKAKGHPVEGSKV